LIVGKVVHINKETYPNLPVPPGRLEWRGLEIVGRR
jgi:hypothetical protein